MSPSEPLGIYIHVPFCRTRCRYCDFYRVGENKRRIDEFLIALEDEIERPAVGGGAVVDSIFLGGGTPSLLLPSQVSSLLSRIRDRFAVTADVEVTLEANPSDLDRERLDGYRAAGVNRLSLGAQSFVDRELQLLGRRHGAEELTSVVRSARRAGFENLSLDLMLAIPGQTAGGLRHSLDRAVELDPDHLSVYILEIHQNSEIDFLRRRRPGLFPSEEVQRQRYLKTSRRLREAGFRHYEISNFCREGRTSRHNLKYWRCRPTLGFGPAAHSLFRGRRWRHPPDLAAYLEAPGRLEEVPGDLGMEELFLGLRLDSGIEVTHLQEVVGLTPAEVDRRVDELPSLVERDGSRIRLSRRGWVVSTSVIGELLDQSRESRATRSISTRAPFGSAATSTVERAGR